MGSIFRPIVLFFAVLTVAPAVFSEEKLSYDTVKSNLEKAGAELIEGSSDGDFFNPEIIKEDVSETVAVAKSEGRIALISYYFSFNGTRKYENASRPLVYGNISETL